MPHGLPALLFHSNLYIKKVTSDKIIKKFLTFLFFKKEKKRIKLIFFFFFFFFFFLGRTSRTWKLLTRQCLLPSKIQNTFNKPKVLTQLESLILITNPNLQSFHIPHSHYKPKFTQNNNWNLSSSLSTGCLKVSSLFKSIAEMTKPLVVRFVKLGVMGLI